MLRGMFLNERSARLGRNQMRDLRSSLSAHVPGRWGNHSVVEPPEPDTVGLLVETRGTYGYSWTALTS
jgi:hypothetical protein